MDIVDVDAAAWDEIRSGLRREADRCGQVLQSPRQVTEVEFTLAPGWSGAI